MLPKLTVILAVLLIALGAGSYILTDRVSITALIPAFFGIAFLIFGGLAFKESLRKHAMHGAATLALLSMLGTVGGVIKGIRSLLGTELERPEATAAQAIMFVLTTIFLALCVQSFIQVRRARRAGESQGVSA